MVGFKLFPRFHQSTITLFFLLLLLGTMLIFNEVTQLPPLTKQVQYSETPLPHEFIDSLVKVTLKNRLGEFQLEKSEKSHDWQLTLPRKLPANPQFLSQLFSSLKKIHIRKVFLQDSINTSSFSLDAPLLQLRLEDKKLKSTQLNLGIINPIDNSAYISLIDGHKKVIYQIDAFKFPFESHGPSDLIDSRIFSGLPDQISEITLFKGKREQKHILLKLSPNSPQWNEEGIKRFIGQLYSSRGQIILDQKSDQLEKILLQLLNSPLYTLEIKEMDVPSKLYTISTPLTHPTVITDLKIGEDQDVAIKASDREHLIIVQKSFLNPFNSFERIQSPQSQKQDRQADHFEE